MSIKTKVEVIDRLFDKNFDTKNGKYKHYYNISGVWALLGIPKSGVIIDNNLNLYFDVLQVAKSIDIGDEIERDILKILSNNYEIIDGKINPKITFNQTSHYNQFSEKTFVVHNDVVIPNINDIIYSYLFEEYDELMFVCIAETRNEKEKVKFEKYFAWKTRAKYWRSGRPFQHEKIDYWKSYHDKIISNIGLTELEIKEFNILINNLRESFEN
ncbi:hypothetical protein [Macrococcus equi]|uniref:hypothetical protein n=1 Tax=Macrococcus equi TaxID=3395462 RepID=UPI0039BE3566